MTMAWWTYNIRPTGLSGEGQSVLIWQVQACMDNENECEELERKVPN